MTDFFGNTECLGFPVRDEAPNALEYTAAEYWVRESYRRYFLANGGIPQLTTWGLERFFSITDTGDPVLELTMELLDSDFKNLFTNAIIKKFTQMLANGASSAAINALLREAGFGGARKPDMLGISAGRTLLFDSVEVGTVRTAQSTYDELGEKMGILRSAVIPQLKLRLPALAARSARGMVSMSIPLDFVVRPSAFRLSQFEMIMPLPVRINSTSGKTIIDWICYHPSTNWRPGGAASAPASPGERTGTDGLIIYHIHQTTLPDVPASIRRAITEELNRWKQAQGYILELNPALVAAFTFNKSAWSREALQLFALLGIGGLVLIMVGIGWESGLFAGAAAIVEAGLTAAASSPAAFAAAMRGTAALANELWPLAVGAAPLIPLGQSMR
jgi:hypothetical protein